MKYSYRYNLIKPRHLRQAITLVKDVFMQFEAPEYSQEGIQTFFNFISATNPIKKAMKKKSFIIWGCYEKSKLIGVSAVRNENHVSLMFVDKDHHRKGIGQALFDLLRQYVKDYTNCTFITVHSSPYAIPFYRSIGFYDTDVEQVSQGIRYTPMQYDL